jgi:hypothetical protein
MVLRRLLGVLCIAGVAAVSSIGLAPAAPAVDADSAPPVTYKLEIVLDIPCGFETTMRRVQSPWGVGYYQLRAKLLTIVSGQPTAITDVTNQATWISSRPAVGGFSTPAGFFRGVSQVGGSTIVVATYGSLTSDDFWITLPRNMNFPGPSGTGGCEQPNAAIDPELGAAVEEIIGALQLIGAWPIDPPPQPGPPSWLPTHPGNCMWIVEEGAGAGGAGAWHPNGISIYRPGISPDEDPDNNGGTGGDLVYLRSNRGNAVVGVDAASAYRLGQLVNANGGLVFPPDLSWFDMFAAIWCAWCRNEDCDESKGGEACSEDDCPPGQSPSGTGECWPDCVWPYAAALEAWSGDNSDN